MPLSLDIAMMNTLDLFAHAADGEPEPIGKQAFLLRGFALAEADTLLSQLQPIIAASPFRHMVTPHGQIMSVAMTNCGQLGWVSDQSSYRYSPVDPVSHQPWPAMPTLFRNLAQRAAAKAGFPDFYPEACLINRYLPGAHLSLHQDKDESNLNAPIVSISFGMVATFLFGGLLRQDNTLKIVLQHADAVVWGGVDRLRYHGILSVKSLPHPALGNQRLNLTFRQVD